MKPYYLSVFILLAQYCQSAHEPSPAITAGDGFREKLTRGKDIYVENQEIGEALDFTTLLPTYTVAPGIRRASAISSITFYKCRFHGAVYAWHNDKDVTTAVSFAKNLTFIACTFDEEVNFRACSVQGLACFSDCIFVKKASFEEADFTDYAVFSQSKFQEDIRFQNAYFRKKADFLHVEFGRNANFQGAVFNLDAQFGAVKSYQAADFSTVQFNGHAFFNYAEWHGQTSFDDAWFKGRCEFMQGKVVTTTLRNCWFWTQPKFNQTNIDISLDVAGTHWLGGQPNWEGIEQHKVLHYRPQ